MIITIVIINIVIINIVIIIFIIYIKNFIFIYYFIISILFLSW